VFTFAKAVSFEPKRFVANRSPASNLLKEIHMADLSSSVKTVIEVLHDGHEGFAKIGEHLEDPTAKQFFFAEAQTRAKFEHELKHAAGVGTEDIGGTAAGGIHRTWGDLKAHLGGGDHTLLDTAEQGEDAAKKAYKEALEDQDIHSSIREVLVRQQSHIAASHDKVKALRDSKK
jgi:uncharacterized protein (TIGR02284 family)